MNMNKLLILVAFAALATGCTSGGGTHRKKSSGGEGGTSGSAPTWDNYEKYYTNKQDYAGNPVADYNFRTSVGDTLMYNIHRYMIDQHKTYLRYNQVTSLFAKTDMKDNGKRETFYTAKENGGTSREHVWCCANSNDLWYRSSQFVEHKMDDGGGPENYWGGGSDIYNLRPTTTAVNTDRKNAVFTTFTEEEKKDTTKVFSSTDGGPYKLYVSVDQKKCEIADYFKGDTARIIMYMWIHYSSIGSYDVYYPKSTTDYNNQKPVYSLDQAVDPATQPGHTPIMCGNLQLTDILGYSSVDECKTILKEWNRIDPPSDLEKKRNDVVEAQIQGLRNPFVDFPQLVDRCLV